jgi:hypothetical protein
VLVSSREGKTQIEEQSLASANAHHTDMSRMAVRLYRPKLQKFKPNIFDPSGTFLLKTKILKRTGQEQCDQLYFISSF